MFPPSMLFTQLNNALGKNMKSFLPSLAIGKLVSSLGSVSLANETWLFIRPLTYLSIDVYHT